MVAIAVHGGAGVIAENVREASREACRAVAELALRELRAGAPALDVVERAVMQLEDDPLFNAGTGAVPTEDGDVELDAMIMCGATWRLGAVATIQNVKNPIAVARRLLESGRHCMMAGAGATEYAREEGFPWVSTRSLRRGLELPAQGGAAAYGASQCAAHGAVDRCPSPHDAQGTVGAVALDAHGHVAAATSTGGMRGKRRGRVGDSPLIGCGGLADDARGAVSATGEGESLMRVQISTRVLDAIAAGASALRATEEALRTLHARTQGRGGLICVTPDGQVALAYNTHDMAGAGVDANGSSVWPMAVSRFA